MSKAKDIEIYINKASVADIEAWLSEKFNPITELSSAGKTTRYRGHIDDKPFQIVVINNVVPKYSSVWFDTSNTKWASDIECARSAYEYFKTEVRCIESGWEEGQDPDQWYSVSAAGEQSVIWK